MLKLRSESLIKTYKSRVVVNNVTVEVNQGEIVGLLGPNGAGKTTSFYMIVGLIPPDKGKIFLGDTELTDLPMYKRAQLGVGYLPQEASVFRNLSVEDNIAAVLQMTALTKPQQKERLEILLSEFGLNRVRKSMGNVLSGGERRRTEIARALATDPKFILLDEPFAGIDPIAVEDIQRIVEKLKQKNIGVLITDHNVRETLSITDRAYLLFEGKILKAGNAEQLAEDPEVRRVYLGQNFELRKKVAFSEKTDVVGYSSLDVYTGKILDGAERLLEIIKGSMPNKGKLALVDAGVEDYLRSVAEYKTMVMSFANSHHNKDLLDKISQVQFCEGPGKYELLLDNPLLRKAMGWKSLDEYRDYFYSLRTTLQQISSVLKIAEGAGV